jgi:hypothetical protein
MTDPDLFSVLDRASQGIEPPSEPHHAAAAALSRARTIRTRRRGLVAGTVAAVAVLAFVVATGVPGLDRSDPPIAPAPTVPAMPDSAVQPTWDPRGAGNLPQGDSALPKTLEPPRDAADLPLAGAARMVLGDGEDGLFLLGQDGTWAATTTPSGWAHGSALSDDGTMLASTGPQGLWVTDVRHGRWRRLEVPPGPDGVWGRIDVAVTWRGDGQVVLRSIPMGVATVDVDGTGSSTPTKYDSYALYGLAQAPDGVAIASGMGDEGPVIREVADGSVSRTFDIGALERLWQPVASADRVVGVVDGIRPADRPTDHAGVIVLDRRDGYAATAYLPIARTHYNPDVGIVAGGVDGVAPLAWIDDSTVLLSRAPGLGRPWSLVAWDVESGELSLLSEGGSTTQPLGVARDLVRD